MTTNMVMDEQEKRDTVRDLTAIFFDKAVGAAIKSNPNLSWARIPRVIQVIQCDIQGIKEL